MTDKFYGYAICHGDNKELNLANDLLFDCIKAAAYEFTERLNDELPELIERKAKAVAEDIKDHYNARLIEHLVEKAFIEERNCESTKYSEYEGAQEAPQTTYLYMIEGGESHKIKIGIAGSIKNRIANLQTSNPEELNVINQIVFDYRSEALAAEAELHEHFKLFRIHPKGRATEWFKPDIKSEAMRIKKEHLPMIAEANRRARRELIDAVNSFNIPMGEAKHD